MNVLVTGAAGLTGGAIVRALMERGVRVLALVRRDDQRTSLPDAVDVAIGDCADPTLMEPIVGSCEALIHVAGIQLGVDLAKIRSLRTLRSVVVVSSAGIYSRHQVSVSVYRAGEEALRAANPHVAIIRPTMVYGSIRDRNVHHVIGLAYRYSVLPLVGDGAARIQPIHFLDLAAATAALIDVSGPVTVDAGGEASVSLREAGEAIFRCLGRPTRFVRVPYVVALSAARAVDRTDVRGSNGRQRWAPRND
jgi:uncharacterized protein YbjT (DUF2867 family)